MKLGVKEKRFSFTENITAYSCEFRNCLDKYNRQEEKQYGYKD